MKQVTIGLQQNTQLYPLRITDSFTAYIKIAAVIVSFVIGLQLISSAVMVDEMKTSRELIGRFSLVKEAEVQPSENTLRVGRTLIPERFFTASK